MVEKFHTAIMEAEYMSPNNIPKELLEEITNTIKTANERILKLKAEKNISPALLVLGGKMYGCCGASWDELKEVYDNAFRFNRVYDYTIEGGEFLKRKMQESLNISEKQFEEVYKEVSNILYSK